MGFNEFITSPTSEGRERLPLMSRLWWSIRVHVIVLTLLLNTAGQRRAEAAVTTDAGGVSGAPVSTGQQALSLFTPPAPPRLPLSPSTHHQLPPHPPSSPPLADADQPTANVVEPSRPTRSDKSHGAARDGASIPDVPGANSAGRPGRTGREGGRRARRPVADGVAGEGAPVNELALPSWSAGGGRPARHRHNEWVLLRSVGEQQPMSEGMVMDDLVTITCWLLAPLCGLVLLCCFPLEAAAQCILGTARADDRLSKRPQLARPLLDRRGGSPSRSGSTQSSGNTSPTTSSVSPITPLPQGRPESVGVERDSLGDQSRANGTMTPHLITMPRLTPALGQRPGLIEQESRRRGETSSESSEQESRWEQERVVVRELQQVATHERSALIAAERQLRATNSRHASQAELLHVLFLIFPLVDRPLVRRLLPAHLLALVEALEKPACEEVGRAQLRGMGGAGTRGGAVGGGEGAARRPSVNIHTADWGEGAARRKASPGKLPPLQLGRVNVHTAPMCDELGGSGGSGGGGMGSGCCCSAGCSARGGGRGGSGMARGGARARRVVRASRRERRGAWRRRYGQGVGTRPLADSPQLTSVLACSLTD